MVYKPGDILFVHGVGFFDNLIQFGQGLRFSKNDSYYNHVALVVSEDGDLVEALSRGVRKTNISKYIAAGSQELNVRARLVSSGMSSEDCKEAVEFALSCEKEGYGWIPIVSTAFCLLFGLKFSIGFDDEDICSGLVSRALEHGGKIMPRNSRHMTPADLAKFYNI